MAGPLTAFILFCFIVAFGYYFNYYFSYIPKIFYYSLSFLILVVPQYTDQISDYIFTKTQILNYDINESKLYNNRLTKKQKRIIINNQNRECKKCKSILGNDYYIKSIDNLKSDLSNYYVICNRCNM